MLSSKPPSATEVEGEPFGRYFGVVEAVENFGGRLTQDEVLLEVSRLCMNPRTLGYGDWGGPMDMGLTVNLYGARGLVGSYGEVLQGFLMANSGSTLPIVQERPFMANKVELRPNRDNGGSGLDARSGPDKDSIGNEQSIREDYYIDRLRATDDQLPKDIIR
eukprot:Gb_13762 [translate_table: standard]